MAWTTITAGQTDAESPVDQTLMDAVRANQTFHGDLIIFAYSEEVNHTAYSSNDYRDVTLDTAHDWRERFIFVTGHVQNYAVATGYVVDGAHEDTVTSDNYNVGGPAFYTDLGAIPHWFFSKQGSANYSTMPYIQVANSDGTPHYTYIWVNASGNLMATVWSGNDPADFCDINLFFFASPTYV
jgi:hypothetical protein